MTQTPHALADRALVWWLAAVEQVVLRALELAGKRLLGGLPRSERHRNAPARQVPVWQIHTTVPTVTAEAADRLLDGALDTAGPNFGGDTCVLAQVRAYCHHLLTTGTGHTRERLASWLAAGGCAPTAPGEG